MAEPINLAPVRVHAVSVPMRSDPTHLHKFHEMMLQANGDDTVQADIFGTDPQGNPSHKSFILNEQGYEQLRKELFESEMATMPSFSSLKSGNTIGRVVGETAPTVVPASQANSPIEAETEEESITGGQVLDGIQLGLDVVGLIPVFGEIADLANAGVSAARGDYVGAGLSLLSAIPFVGYLGTAGKATRYGAKMAEASGKAGKEVAEKTAKKKASEPIETNLNNATGGKVGQRQPPPNQIDKSWKDKIEGTAQRTGDDSAHQIRTYREAIKLAKDPDVVSVNLDHGYNRSLSQNPKTFSPNRRPDVTAVYNDKRIARVEVQSKTDNPAILRSRNSALDAQLRNEGFRPLPPKVVKPTRTPKP